MDHSVQRVSVSHKYPLNQNCIILEDLHHLCNNDITQMILIDINDYLCHLHNDVII